ncbi:M15 family metallopeptidase [Arenibacter sp. GZD96]|uniref:M15 family metallopeptidase n=1 Tax=Aurantibrevibacter litoralis TaxID=3106030 RepID=UPI002AFFFE78|nr:M15 family metallopeptidase [Arenibacter sp. GZD-96]MEA1787413.1 M15 family metallopeptidase [Arenibacter sp. GZD-96]
MRGKILFFGGICCCIGFIVLGCKEKPMHKETGTPEETKSIHADTVQEVETALVWKPKSLEGIADTTFVRLADFSVDFVYDMRYATTQNFLNEKVYACAECYTRVKTAKALLQANAEFMAKGYKIKFFDCYRPRSVQYKMWAIVSNPQYVADPKKGSIHNRGGAVDITLVTLDGKELDMGTDFDYFGRKAYHDNFDLPEDVLIHRKLLKETMEKHGFWSVRSEWWHYNLSAASSDAVANFNWPCTD